MKKHITKIKKVAQNSNSPTPKSNYGISSSNDTETVSNTRSVRLLKKSGQIAQNKVTSVTGNKVKEIRDKTIHRDNWNYYVQDEDLKTDFFLRFKDSAVSQHYAKHLVSSSAYSLKVVLIAMALLNLYNN